MSITSLRDVTHTSLQSAASQIDSFCAVLDATNHYGRRHLISSLQNLEEAKGKQDDRANILFIMKHCLLYGISSADYAAKVSQLVTVLAGLSTQGISEMLSMAVGQRPTDIVVHEDDGHDMSILTTSASHTASGTTVGTATGSTTIATASGTTMTAPSTAELNSDDNSVASS